MGKLTKAQAELLASLPTTCADHYPPARALVQKCLARWERGNFGDRLVITPAGRAALEDGREA